MINKSLLLLPLLSATLGYAQGTIGTGGVFLSKCQSANAQLVIESKASEENIRLRPWIVTQSNDGGISGSSGTSGNKSEIVVGISPAAFSQLKSFIEYNDDVSILGKNGSMDIDAINIYAKLQLIELELENVNVKLVGGGSGGNIPSSAKGGTSGGGSTISDGGSSGTPTITDSCTFVAESIFAHGGATGAGGTIGYEGISGGSGVITVVDGGSGIGSGGWTKEVDGIAVGGGSPE